MVSMLALNSDDTSSNPLTSTIISAKFVFEKNKKEAGVGPFLKKLLHVKYVARCHFNIRAKPEIVSVNL